MLAEVNPLVVLGAAGLVGLGLGFGLVLGAFTARSLRRYMREEHLKPYGDDDEEPRGRHGR